jgi:hypothetical protein
MFKNPFRRQNAPKKWRSRAWLIDPRETKITILAKFSSSNPSRHLPPWIYRKSLED